MTTNQKLALAAFVLGAFAVLGNPYRGHAVRVDTRELATIVESEVDHVTPVELAGWIIEGDEEYRLIDLRPAAQFSEYHIPNAENVPITALEDYPLYRNERIVLYSGGGIHSAQAWFLLKARGFEGSYILLGGLDAWVDEVLFPSVPEAGSVENRQTFDRLAEVSRFFGGTPGNRESATAGKAPAPLPRVEAPQGVVVPKPKKKKKEGC